MAVLRHFSIKNNPLATLKYITGETKKQRAEIVTGINCSDDAESSYIEMKLCYEHYAGEKFHRTANPTGKEHLKMHHYIISFKDQEVTPEQADKIAQEWAKDVFGNDRQILIATHTDTDNIHVHLAVNAYSLNGKRWLDNKSTLKLCREKVNKICKSQKLTVIEHPKWDAGQNYAEWLERQNGTSWKQKLCDDIDRIVLMENVRSIDDLVVQLCKNGYLVRHGKYLSVKPAKQEKRKPVRTLKLGDGYGLEELLYRIKNKNREMSLDKVLSYTGVQREYALCLRQIQIILYRNPEENPRITYKEVLKTAELLCYVHEHNIHSKEDFEKHVNKIAEKSDEIVERHRAIEAKIKDLEYIVKNGEKYIEMVGLYHKTRLSKYYDEYKNMKPCIENQISAKEDVGNAAAELEKLHSELADMQEDYEKAVSDKKTVTAHYSTFVRQLETDYAYYCKAGQKELAEYEANLSKPPKKQFSEVVQQMSDWADMALEKVAEKERAEARKNLSDYSR